MMNEPLSTIMTTEVVTLGPKNTMADAKKLFVERSFHHIPVVDGEKLVGVVTKSDLWKTGKSFDEYGNILLEDIMVANMVHLASTQRIGVAAELFLENNFRYIPIVDGDKLEGIISSFDIMMYSFKKEYPRQFD